MARVIVIKFLIIKNYLYYDITISINFITELNHVFFHFHG